MSTSFSSGWENVLHIYNQGDVHRIASIFFNANNDSKNRIHIYNDLNGNGKYMFSTPHYPLGEMLDIMIEQVKEGSQYFLQVNINQQLIHRAQNKKPREHKNMFMYVSSPLFSPQHGYIRDLKYSAT